MKPLTTIAAAAALALSGCATASGYELTSPPRTNPNRFTAVDVAPVAFDSVPAQAVCPVTDSPPDTASNCPQQAADELATAIRRGIVDGLTGSGDLALVVAELDPGPGALLISCAVLQFDEGSRTLRYLVGMGAGKAVLRLTCRFTDLDDDAPYAEGVFRAELKGGLFGGAADGQAMGKQVGEAIRDFLRTGQPE